MPTPTPHTTYTQNHDYHRDDATALEQRNQRLSLTRAAVFLVAVIVGWMAFQNELFHPVWTLIPVAGFLYLVRHHDQVIRRQRQAQRRTAFYEAGLARLEDRWAGTGNLGDAYDDPKHPYAGDLDVFGKGSLFERLCTVRTADGERTLAAWLLAPAAAEEITARQEAVDELRGRLELREDLALVGEDVQAALHADTITEWVKMTPWRPSWFLRPLTILLTTASIWTLVGWILWGWGPSPFLLTLLAIFGLQKVLFAQVGPVLEHVDRPSHELELLAQLLGVLEKQPMECARLRRIREQLQADGKAPSTQINRLARLVQLLDARRNQFFAPFGILLFWDFHVAHALEKWRITCGPAVPGWLQVIGEFEALCALAGYAYERPELPFPTLRTDGPPAFEAVGLRHPLLPNSQAVANDLRIGGDRDAENTVPTVWIVSGSNMSGKSTLMRAVGTNAVLAQMGAPVCATSLTLTPLSVGASIQVRDSLHEGKSRFYAEITRIQSVLELGKDDTRPPLLFLLDEILHGTNSHDRRIGAEGIVRSLANSEAIGLVTTHDLALTQLADSLPQVDNVHFQDTMVDGKMHFDYQLRPGVVTKSNALELMRAVGLDV